MKMRRGLNDGSRDALDVGPQLVEAGAAALTLHPRSAKQMYTGTADHSLTAELVERVDVPVIASGDVTSHARSSSSTRPAAPQSWSAAPRRETLGGRRDRRRPRRRAGPRRGRRRARPLHPRHGGRAGRAARHRLPEEVLRLVPRPRPLPEAVQAGAGAARDPRGGGGAALRRGSGAVEVLARLEGDLPADVLLDLPISVYGGG